MIRLAWALPLLLLGCLRPLEKPVFLDDPDQDFDGDGYAEAQGDCDDADPTRFPGAVWYVDADGDYYGNPLFPVEGCVPPEGTVPNDDDCNDDDAAVHPGADERCNGRDDDCDAYADDDDPDSIPVDQNEFYADLDDDTWGDDDADRVYACYLPVHAATRGDDCDDGNPDVHPEADEVCNHVDDDCDGATDDEDDGVLDQATWYPDGDGDGYGEAHVTGETACFGDDGTAPNNADCNDDDPAINPAADELCDGGVDNNCDGEVEGAGGAVDAVVYYDDTDADGFGDPDTADARCRDPGDGYSTIAGDCDDGDPQVNPDVAEVCDDGVDDDCDSFVDGDDEDCR